MKVDQMIAKLRRERFDPTPQEPTEVDIVRVADLFDEPGVATLSPEFATAIAAEIARAYRRGWNARGDALARELEQARTEQGLRELAEAPCP